ncbi:MAG TPA: ATP-binding protein [Gemmatimonadales bacterium]|nr:ATP-binding protein [Gemmatimonadales bacterium]
MTDSRADRRRPAALDSRAAGVPADGHTGDLFAGGGEMGALMRSMDWSKTRLGPVEQWPRSLRTMLGVVLGSRFPMLLWWGPDLLHLYNDAYRPILRDKHPESLVAPAADVWAEVWDIAGPMARSVQEGGPATWTEDLQLFIKSGDMAEETYFTFSYSPVPGDDGLVGGLLNTVQETTAKVRSERQIRMLHDLAARASDAKSEDDAYKAAAEVLAGNELDLPFALLYVLGEKADHARLAAASGWKHYHGCAKPAEVPIAEHANGNGWPFAEVLRVGQDVVVDDLASRFELLPPGRWNGRPERAIILPLFRAGQGTPYALMVAGVSPHRTLDERYRRCFRDTADQVANVVANARAYEAEKKRAESLAEIDRAKTVFFSNVSHEFRTPLTLILGPIENALSQPSKLLQEDSLRAVHRNALRLLRLVNSLLDFARIEAGRLQLSLVPTDLSALTADLASSFRSLIERAGLTLTVDCPPLPEPVRVDPSQWEKIVLNLISNAFKFTFTGGITVGLCSRGTHVELTVRDSGTGIPAHELPHIFERFHRVQGAKGRSFEGTGIGLSLVRELVRLHGGTLTASSVEGEGTTMEVSIPAGTVEPDAARIGDTVRPTTTSVAPYLLEASQWIGPGQEAWEVPSASVEDIPASSRAETAGRERARVLVADDNADMRDYLAGLLSSCWRVEVVEDGERAFARALEQPPDLVLSDVMMPRLDGFALLRQLRAHPHTRQIPVVLLSARAGEDAVLEGLETGADDYLVKPFSARELLARVQTHLEMARIRRKWSRELELANQELEAFSYSVSHDLRAPLRAIDGFSQALLEDHSGTLDDEGRGHLERVRSGTRHMGQLIDDLLSLSQVSRASLHLEPVDMTDIARTILMELGGREPDRRVESRVSEGLVVQADSRLLTVMLGNLLGNAWKFTSRQPVAIIEVGQEQRDDDTLLFVRDNGVGFDLQYAVKLFTPFQRFHSAADFEGTGIGLATVRRIVVRHGGRIWAETSPGHGATFYFTLHARS